MDSEPNAGGYTDGGANISVFDVMPQGKSASIHTYMSSAIRNVKATCKTQATVNEAKAGLEQAACRLFAMGTPRSINVSGMASFAQFPKV